jgi:2-C-methyl-D-erythritol 4-phosphate cytidylyltransferase / 2-C-methyl-D-erythritol 2,4-cyclodiphosphate synthase
VSRVDVVIVAAGASTRMAGVDKVRAPVGGRPLLAWTIAALEAAPSVRRIVVVAAPDRVAEIMAAPWLSRRVSAVARGGARRQDSVAAGVVALGDGAPDDVILVHDGARPLVSSALVERVAAAAAMHGAAVPVVPVAETLKRIENGVVAGTVDRAQLAAAQTPQGIRRDVLARAWAQQPPDGAAIWTDEASMLEACRIPVHAVPGESTNLKVTLPDDLERVAAALVARGDVAAPVPAVRVGFGDDGHAFGPGAPLRLGGLVIEGAPALHGHSDGDVALHAICDALLGAAGLGDLGRHFPAGRATPTGIASGELLATCVEHVRAAGFAPVSIDVTIIGARPRLAGRLDAMAASVADLVGIPARDVNVKASTGNLIGYEGAGRGISARAVAVVGAASRTERPKRTEQAEGRS